MARPTGRFRKRIKQASAENPWTPLPWQVTPFHDRSSKVVLLTGSAGGGKSDLGCRKAHQVCLSYPGAFVLAIRKTRASMTSSTALFLENQVIKGAARHVKFESQFRYPNGSILKYAGMGNAQERERIRSIGRTGGVDHIFIDEATQLYEDDYNELLARLRGRAVPWLQVVLATNPDSEFHWINLRLINAGEATVHYSKAKDNPYQPPDYQGTLDSLTGVQRARLADGKWASAEGVVHSNFDRQTNIVERFEIPDDWLRIGSIDFGFENPSVAQWWALDGDKRMYLYRELYQTRMLAADLAKEIIRLSGDEQVHWVADHAASERATLADAGVFTDPAEKGVADGLSRVNTALRVAEDGKPRMMLFADALVSEDSRLRAAHKPTCTAEEFPGYTWDKRASGELTDKPAKVNDHGMDATRYAKMYADSFRTPFLITS